MNRRYFAFLSSIFFATIFLSGQDIPLTRESFISAIRKSDLPSVQKHLAAGYGGDLLANEKDKTTALMVSLRFSEAVTKTLIEAGIKNPDAREIWLNLGETALMKAVLLGSDETVFLLLKNGADPKLKNRFGWNALHFAAWAGKSRVVQKLLSLGLSPSEATAEGWTPLHLAARFARAETCRLLAAAGADPFQKTPGGQTPVGLARLGDFDECLRQLDPTQRQSTARTFSIQKNGFGAESLRHPGEDLKTVRLTAKPENGETLEIQIVPAFGNVIRSLRRGTNDLLKPVDSSRLTEISGGLPILFPAPNAVSEARLTVSGREIEMHSPDAPRPFLMHGTAWQSIWKSELPKVTEKSVQHTSVCKMDAENPGWPAFPFSNSLRLTCTLTPESLRLDFEISNQDTVTLPLGLGVHPYWNVLPGTKVRLDADHLQSVTFSALGRSSSEATDPFLNATGFYPSENWNPATRFYLRSPGESSRISWPRFSLGLTTHASSELSLLVIYRPSFTELCLEHQSSAPDAHRLLASGKGAEASLLLLAPGQSKKLFIEYRLEKL